MPPFSACPRRRKSASTTARSAMKSAWKPSIIVLEKAVSTPSRTIFDCFRTAPRSSGLRPDLPDVRRLHASRFRPSWAYLRDMRGGLRALRRRMRKDGRRPDEAMRGDLPPLRRKLPKDGVGVAPFATGSRLGIQTSSAPKRLRACREAFSPSPDSLSSIRSSGESLTTGPLLRT